MSAEEDVQESEESTSDNEEQDPCVLHGIDDESVIEREARQLRRQRHAHRPPTVEEIQEHLRTHLPYPRRRNPGENSVEVATVATNCCFLRNTPGEESIPVLIMRDRQLMLFP